MINYGREAQETARKEAAQRNAPENRKGPSRETPEDVRRRCGDKRQPNTGFFNQE